MSAFADSSALVKLYADEPGFEAVRDRRTYVVSALARVEVPAALWRKQRMGELPAEACSLLVRAFTADLLTGGSATRLLGVAITDRVLTDAARLTGSRGLRAYDAVQLACARAARAADPEITTFACFDRALSDAAAAEGFGL